MKNLLILLITAISINAFSQENKTQIFILGSDHLAQIYKEGKPNTDVFTPSAQKSIDDFNNLIAKYQPDAIMIEDLPAYQNEIDSLYERYKHSELQLRDIKNGRSEIFNIAFSIGKKLNIRSIYCVNAPGGTSQSILDNGDNIQLYKDYAIELRKLVMEKYNALESGELTFKNYLSFLNQPQAYERVYRLRYIIPARVTNGYFKQPDKTIDTTRIDQNHIGAELISIFKNRDYKIYSNIINTQLKTGSKKILLIIGVAHIGSLKNIFNEDPWFQVVDADKYLMER